jgi:hypothetical protein
VADWKSTRARTHPQAIRRGIAFRDVAAVIETGAGEVAARMAGELTLRIAGIRMRLRMPAMRSLGQGASRRNPSGSEVRERPSGGSARAGA